MRFTHPWRTRILGWLAAPMYVTGLSAAEGTLKSRDKPLLWSGSVVRTGGPVRDVPQCAAGCQRYDLTVALPASTWKKPGGVQIAIRWTGLTSAMAPAAELNRVRAASAATSGKGEELGDSLRLYVYKDGNLVASSEGESALAQSVLIRKASNGQYRVYAVYEAGSPRDEIAYEGLAEVEFDPNPQPVRPLLPDLEARPQRHVTFDPGPIFSQAISPDYPSCYYTEVVEEGAKTCLRFDQVFANTGEGGMDIGFTVPRGSMNSTHKAYQRIFWSSGTTPFQEHEAGQVEFHAGHSHYHVMTFAHSRLWSVDDNTDRKKPTGLKLVRSGRKVSFCMVDTEMDAWAKKGDGAKRWKAPDCNFPVSSDDAGDHYRQGVTPGWKDVYEWYLPHQYIEVTGVPDGLYILETAADPSNLLLEANKSNNCGSIYILLSGMQTPNKKAAIAGPGPACSQLVMR